MRRDAVPEPPAAALPTQPPRPRGPAADEPAGRGAGARRRPARAARSLRSNPARQQRVLAIVLGGRGAVAAAGRRLRHPARRTPGAAGGGHRPVADAVAAPRQVGVAGAGGQRAGLRRSQGQRGRPDAPRAGSGQRRRRAQARARGQPVRRRTRQDHAAGRARRQERQGRAGPAADPDAGRHRAARHQSPVFRPARNDRDRGLAQDAAERHRCPRSRPPASW